jgi:hypothetical protein
VALIAPHGHARLLGRGESLTDDPAPRHVFQGGRSGLTGPTPPLAARRMSRQQLVVTPAGNGLTVKSLGRAALHINGRPTEGGRVSPGDTLRVGDSLVLLVGRRARTLAAQPNATTQAPFGTPDSHGFVGESPAMWTLRGNDRHGRLKSRAQPGRVRIEQAAASTQVDPNSLDAESIQRALAEAGGQVSKAAALLGLSSRHALDRLLKKHGLET